MNVPENDIAWLTDPAVRDLIQRFPLSIALLDAAGGALVLNDHFERGYGSEALDSASLQALMREPVSGWRTVRMPARGLGEVEVKAQLLRIQGHAMLIFDDATDPRLLLQLEQLHGQITELERISSTDRLTGAWNRAHLDRVIAAELDRSIRFRQSVSLILFDVDHFKRVNDTYGHQTGDSVLCELVQVIGTSIRSVDALFRWGGEEFVVLASSTGHRSAAKLAEKLRAGVEQHRFARVGLVTLSLGVAEHIATESTEIWFRRADDALYRAKSAGRNCVRVDQRGSSDAWAAENGASVIHLAWQEAYECGEPTIDREHRELFELANALLDASFKSESSPQTFSAALETLLTHIARHFVAEEALLAKHGYQHLEAHRLAHAGLLARAGELKASVAAGRSTFGDLVEFLANTVVAQHLFKADREFYPLFNTAAENLRASSPI